MNLIKCLLLGIVRFIGRVHFAHGTWLGIELKEKAGRNDGSVKGRRYFACKKGYGVMVPPSKVTVHGLNGASLLKQEGEEKEDDDDEEEAAISYGHSSANSFLLI